MTCQGEWWWSSVQTWPTHTSTLDPMATPMLQNPLIWCVKHGMITCICFGPKDVFLFERCIYRGVPLFEKRGYDVCELGSRDVYGVLL